MQAIIILEPRGCKIMEQKWRTENQMMIITSERGHAGQAQRPFTAKTRQACNAACELSHKCCVVIRCGLGGNHNHHHEFVELYRGHAAASR